MRLFTRQVDHAGAFVAKSAVRRVTAREADDVAMLALTREGDDALSAAPGRLAGAAERSPRLLSALATRSEHTFADGLAHELGELALEEATWNLLEAALGEDGDRATPIDHLGR